MADMLALRRLLPNHDKALSWLPDPSDAEMVRWINVGLEKAWPFFKEASSGIIKVQLQAVFNNYRSGAIQELSIGKINLGRSCPYVQGIKALHDDEGNKTCLEIQLDWRQNEDQEMVLHVSTSGPEYVVQVKHFVMYAVMKLTFTPLKEELPCFAAVVFSIIEPPLVDFQTRFISGDVKKMPEMQKAVDSILLAALMDLLVWPSRVVVPFIPGDYSNLEASCVGHLHVQLLEATELANKDIAGRSDPYVVLFVRWRQDLTKESSRMCDTSEPVWNEQFLFNVEDSAVQKLTIKVMNLNDINLDEYVGTAELAINQLEANIQKDLWIDLVGDPTKLRGKYAGKVHLLLEYKPLNSICTEYGSSKVVVGETSPSAVSLLTESNKKAGLCGERDETAVVNNATEGLRVVLEGQRTRNSMVENHVSRPSTRNTDVVTESPSDQSVLGVLHGTSKPTADTKIEPLKLEDSDKRKCSIEDETGVVSRADNDAVKLSTRDGDVVAACPISSECESGELHVSSSDVVGGMESQPGISTESFKERQPSREPSRDLLEGTSGLKLEKGSEAHYVEDQTQFNYDTDKSRAMLDSRDLPTEGGNPDVDMNQDHSTGGWNGFTFKLSNSSVMHEDLFASEIFEVD